MTSRSCLPWQICFLLVLAVFPALPLPAQQYNLVARVSLARPVSITAGLPGNVYVQTAGGVILKYNTQGEELARVTPTAPEAATTLDAGQSLRLFAFYAASQQFQYFDRQLEPSAFYPLPATDFYSQAAPSSDQGIWLWNASQVRLEKYRPALQDVIVSTPARFYLSENHRISQVQEYQHHVYVGDQAHEILVFDLLGNYIQKLPVAKVARFDFIGDELYWLHDHTINLYHLYQGREQQMKLPDSVQPLRILLLEDRLFVLEKARMLIFRILHR